MPVVLSTKALLRMKLSKRLRSLRASASSVSRWVRA